MMTVYDRLSALGYPSAAEALREDDVNDVTLSERRETARLVRADILACGFDDVVAMEAFDIVTDWVAR